MSKGQGSKTRLVATLGALLLFSCAEPQTELRERQTPVNASKTTKPSSADTAETPSNQKNPSSSTGEGGAKLLLLQWDSPQGEVASYQLFVKDSMGGEEKVVGEISTKSPTFSLTDPRYQIDFGKDPNLAGLIGKKVCFYIKALNASGASPASDDVCLDPLE